MSALFYYRHLLGDYARDTKELSALEHGVYRLLLDAYYAKQGPISAAPADLYRCAVAFTPEEQAAVAKIVGLYFVEREGKLHNKKCDEEIARVLKESASQAKKAHARWGKQAVLASDDAAASAGAPPAGQAAAPAGAPAAAPAGGMPGNSHSQKAKKERPPKSPNLLPEWLPTVEWDAYLAMRQRKRKPATDRAITLIINELDALRMQGHPPGAVLDQSTKESWTGVFPLKHHHPAAGRRATTEARNDDTAAAWADGE